MADFGRARRAMVDGQLRTGGITDWRILAAMDEVPRERFLPEALRPLAYLDDALAVSPSRFIPAPARFARLVQLAEVGSEDRVLDIACGSGYSAAVLARLAKAATGLEDDPALVARAEETFEELGIGNARAVAGALTEGVPAAAAFDVIVIEGAVEQVPEALFNQLAEGGRLVAVHGHGNAASAHLYLKSGKAVLPRIAFNVSLPVLEAFSRPPAFAF